MQGALTPSPSTPSSVQQSQSKPQNWLLRLDPWAILVSVCAGSIFIIFNFEGVLRHAGRSWATDPTLSSWLLTISSWPQLVTPSLDRPTGAVLVDLLTSCILGIWLYLAT